MTQQETADVAQANPEAEAATPSMPRIAVASFTGTVIEFYDFLIYGTAAALVFPEIFFPALGTAAGTVASFATLGVAFVARPFGSVLFGHFGDRLGRKKTLIATLLLMGVATVLTGLMPTAGQIGVAAPILVVILRVLQGLAAGGEWAGAVLFGSEHAPKARRGFWSMFPSLGAGVALSLANATFLVTGLGMSEEAFADYGWRIPFLVSILLVGVGLWVRLRMDETPVFTSEVTRSGASRMPFAEAFRRQPRQVVLASGVAIMTFALTYVGANYLTNYGTHVLGLPRATVLGVGIAGGLALSAGIVLGGTLSDRFGRRRVIMSAAAVAVVWTLALFPILDTRSTAAFVIGLCVTMFVSGVECGPLGAFLSELFHTRYRYTAAGLSYNTAAALGGAVPPLVAAAVTAAYGGFAFGMILAGLCAVTLVCTYLVGETREFDMDRH